MDKDVWRRAEELFHAALERAPESRPAFLDEACGASPELRRQLEALLSRDEQAGSFLEQPIMAAGGVAPRARGALVGRRYGPYRILSLLGAGGMGEVYRAHDGKLDRDVAIKTLPPEFARDPERLARFRREARALAALNHPNIATIHGLEESEEASYLVLELVEGETPKGPLSLATALDLAGQVAEALQAAHERGIVHRDLKPANLKVTAQGRVKVLDFGLAKAMRGEPRTPAPSPPPAATGPGTRLGHVVGTPGYMSPEQARGEEVDQRTDIWAFGCLLYELLAGKRAFERQSVSGGKTEAPGDEPNWEALPASTPSRIRDLLRQCLQRNANRRLRRIAEARAAIREVQQAAGMAEDLRGTSPSSVPFWPALTPRPRRGPKWSLPVAAALGVIAAAAAVSVAVSRLSHPSFSPAHSTLTMPSATVLDASPLSQLAVAADGRGVVFLGRNGGRRQLYWHDLRGTGGWPLPGTEAGHTPFLSPDGRWLGFFRDGKILKLPLEGGRIAPGGRVEEVAASRPPRGAAWCGDGTIVYSPFGGGLKQVAAAGGQPRRLTEPSLHEFDHRWPSCLPGGREVLFTVHHEGARGDRGVIAVVSLDSGRITRVLEGFVHARCLPSGHLVFGRYGRLYVVAFDPKTLRAAGKPEPVLDDVSFNPATGALAFDVATDGGLVYANAKADPPGNALVWVTRDGDTEEALPERRAYDPINLVLSPDGRRVATIIESKDLSTLWVCDLHDRRCRQLRLEADCYSPVWSPDGGRVAFASNLDGALNLYVVAADGKSPPTRLGPPSRMTELPRAWSGDGRFLAYEVQTPGPPIETHVLQVDSRANPSRWGPAGAEVSEPSFSPDGRWLAYQSRESGRWEVWVRPFPGPGPSQRVSGKDGGLAPVWEGREIYYVERLGDTRIMSRRVESSSPLRLASASRVAFALPFAMSNDDSYISSVFSVEPGGRRVLVVRQDERAPIRALNVIANWPEEVMAKLRRGR